MNGGSVVVHFKGDSSNLDKSITNTFGNLTSKITAGNLLAKGISKAFGAVSNSMDSAISRLDTMNNFPKVMSNLGIGTQDAQKSIDKLSNKLTGLPTTLDSATLAVQRFTTKNNDVGKSTDMFLALNNAILAGGASMEIQSSALEQVAQAYAKGKPDMMEWRTMLTAMPAQINQVASAMGMSAEELGVGLREGNISMEEFMNTIMKLNTEGVNGFASFEEQARGATGGIQTNLKNLQTAISRGVANTIQAINDSLSASNLPTIQEMIQSATKVINKAFKSIQDFIKSIDWNKIISDLKTIATTAGIIGSVILAWKFGSAVQSAVQGFQMMKVQLALLKMEMGTTTTAGALLQYGITGVKTAMSALNIVMKANPIGLIVTAITLLVGAFIYLWNTSEGFRNFWIGLWEGIKNVVSGLVETFTNVFNAIWNFIKPIVEFIANIIKAKIELIKNIIITIVAVVSIILETIFNIFKTIFTAIWNFISPIFETIKTAFSFIGSIVATVFNGIKTVITTIFSFIWNNIISPVINRITNAFNTIKSVATTVFNAIKTVVSNVFNAIGNIIKVPINGIIGAINTVLKGINKIKVPDWVPGLGGKSPNFSMIPKLATGTNYVPEDTLAMIHKGEAVVPKKFNPYNGEQIFDDRTLSRMSSTYTPNIINNIDVSVETDPLGQTVSNIKTFSGGAKNDYNYGYGG